MKSYKVTSLYYISVLMLLAGIFAACENTASPQDKYIGNGEIIYPQSSDTVLVSTGRLSVTLKMPKPTDPKVTTARIYWNNNQDSVDATYRENEDTLSVSIDTLKSEGSYTFKIYNYDNKGNKSVAATALAKVYGPQYEMSLLNRPINAVKLKVGTSNVSLEWGNASSGTIGTRLAYTNTSNNSDTVFVPVDSTTTEITNFKSTGTITYRTLFKPDSAATDTFYAQEATAKVTQLILEEIQPSGSGTSGDPYQIASLNNLVWLSNNSSSWSSYFIQTTDIDASFTSDPQANSFSPIGASGGTVFSGSYDGQDHTISNLYIKKSSGGGTGLFGFVDGNSGSGLATPEVKNLGLIDVDIDGEGAPRAAGLAGRMRTSVFENCFVTGTVKGGNRTGGLIGEFNVTGGIVRNCYSTADVSSSMASANALGGLIGLAYNGPEVTNSYSSGKVHFTSGGSGNIGGLIASEGGSPATSVNNSYWDTDISGQSSSIGGTGLTTMEMQQQSKFTGFDFGSVWVIDEGSSYPYLQNNKQNPPPAP